MRQIKEPSKRFVLQNFILKRTTWSTRYFSVGNSVTNWFCFQNRSPGGAQPELQTKPPWTVTSGRTSPKGNLANWMICHPCWYLSERRIQPVIDLKVRHIKKLTMCPKKKLSASLPKKPGKTTLWVLATKCTLGLQRALLRSTLPRTGPSLPRGKCNNTTKEDIQTNGHEQSAMEASGCGGTAVWTAAGRTRGAHLRALASSTTWRETAREAREGRQERRSARQAHAWTDETHTCTPRSHERRGVPLRYQMTAGEAPRHLYDTGLCGGKDYSGNSARAGHQKGQEPTAIRGGAQRAAHAHLRKGGGSRKRGRGEVPTDSIPGVQVREGSKGTVAHPAAQGPAAQARPRRTRV